MFFSTTIQIQLYRPIILGRQAATTNALLFAKTNAMANQLSAFIITFRKKFDKVYPEQESAPMLPENWNGRMDFPKRPSAFASADNPLLEQPLAERLPLNDFVVSMQDYAASFCLVHHSKIVLLGPDALASVVSTF